MKLREVVALGWVAWLGGCGLVLDLQPDLDAGATGMDARVADAGDPPLACTPDEGCPDDGDACTTAERCVEGRCVTDTVTCDDGIACTIDSCDPAQGCTHRTDDAACAEVVPDGDCRVPRCDPVLGCVLEPSDARCDDGFACTEDTCGRDGVCANEADDVACALSVAPSSVCDPATGQAGSGCTEVDCGEDADCALAPTPCVLGGQCVEGVCRPEQVANDTACDDGLFCTTASSCQSGICVGSTRRPCSDGDACTADACVEGATEAICVHEPDPAKAGAACDDGLPCTGPGECTEEGACAPGTSTCSATALCQIATCTSAGCAIASPCEEQNRRCLADGLCGACQSGFADCDGVGGCECPLGVGRGCFDGVCANLPLDASVSLDASLRVDASVRVDASLRDAGSMNARDAAPRDATLSCLRPDVDGDRVCGAFEDCDGDGCCECDRSSHFCGTGGGGAAACLGNLLCTEVCGVGQECCPCTGTCDAECDCSATP